LATPPPQTTAQPSPLDLLIAQYLLTHPALAQWMQNRRDAYLNSIVGTRLVQLVNILRGAQQTALRTGKPADPADIEQQLNSVLAGPKIGIPVHGANVSQIGHGQETHEDQTLHGAPGGPAESSAGNVGQTEVSAAVAGAAHVVYREAGVAEHEWVTAEDEKVCPICAANETAGPITLGLPFPSGDLIPPAHPRCRCTTTPVEAQSVEPYVQQREQEPLRWWGWPNTSLEEEVRLQNKSLANWWLHKVGPHGYIHGWIYVGAPGTGEDLRTADPNFDALSHYMNQAAGRALSGPPAPKPSETPDWVGDNRNKIAVHVDPANGGHSSTLWSNPSIAKDKVGKQLDNQARYVPGVVYKTRVNVTDQGVGPLGNPMGPNTVGSNNIGGYITLKPKVLNPVDGDALLYSDTENGWWVKPDQGQTLADLVTAHEVGHGVAAAFFGNTTGTDTGKIGQPSLWGPLADAIGAPKPDLDQETYGGKEYSSYSALSRWATQNRESITSSVSRYAAKNLNETLAELWAEYTTNSHPRNPAKLYGDWVMKNLPHRTTKPGAYKPPKYMWQATPGMETSDGTVLSTSEWNWEARLQNKSLKDYWLHKVGPKGYIHGWIYVGSPTGVMGRHVTHPVHGTGKIVDTHSPVDERGAVSGEQTVTVQYKDGTRETYGFRERGTTAEYLSPGLQERPTSPPQLKPPVSMSTGFTMLESEQLTVGQRQALTHYVQPDSNAVINGTLRGHVVDYQPDQPELDRAMLDINTMDKLLTAHTLTSPATTYRGIALTPALRAQMKPGATFTDKAYVSTTTSLDWARKFAQMRATGHAENLPEVASMGGTPTVLKLSIPTGSHMIPGEPDIGEYVLPRSSSFRVDQVTPGQISLSYLGSAAPAVKMPSLDQQASHIAAVVMGQHHSSERPVHTRTKAANPRHAAAAQRMAWAEDEIEFGPVAKNGAGASEYGRMPGWCPRCEGKGCPECEPGDEEVDDREALAKCLSCGCGLPHDDHGDKRNITLDDVEAAGTAMDIAPGQAGSNIADWFRTEQVAAAAEPPNKPKMLELPDEHGNPSGLWVAKEAVAMLSDYLEKKNSPRGSAQTLRDYWSGHGHSGPSHGAFEHAIAWGTPGDFDRCVAMVTEHAKMSPDHAKGYCNLRHHDALGIYPATHAKDIREGEGKK
jgi:SPP1 gp7 family putative phage head morphogenesis protein